MSISEILPGLYVGDAFAAQNPNIIKKYNIGAIINFTPDVPNKFKNQGIAYMRVYVNDSLQQEDIHRMTIAFPHVLEFTDKYHHKQGKNILYHCLAGRQRSAINAVLYLMVYKKLSLSEAVNYLLNKRPIVFSRGHRVNFLPSIIDFFNN